MVSGMITKDQIKAARAMLGITQAELAEKAGVSLATLNNIERETHADPSISTIHKIQNALGKLGIVFTASGESFGIRLKRKSTKDRDSI